MITSNYYSLGGPTLAHRLLAHYDMDPSTDKYHVLGVGCASAVPLFKLAGQALRDHPDKHALVVAADSITGFLTPVAAEDERTKIVGSALFGDGCAAALLTSGSDERGAGPVAATRVHQVGQTLDAVAFQLARRRQLHADRARAAGDRRGGARRARRRLPRPTTPSSAPTSTTG